MKKRKIKSEYTSWKTLFRFYTRIRIPWVMIAGVFAFSLAVKELESRMVPYTSAIMTGAIDKHGFLGGFIVMTILYNSTEAIQGGLNELSAAVTTRNVRHTVWRKLIHLPMSVYNGKDSQRFISRITQDTTGAYAAIACVIQLWAIIYGLYTNFIKMYRVYHSLALVMLSAIPITILVSIICGRMQYKMENIINSSCSEITNFFGERLPNLQHIKTCGTEDEEYLKGIKASNDKYKADVRKLNLFIFQGPLGTLAQYVNEIILLIVASMLVRSNIMKMSQMVNLYNYFLLFMGNAFMITACWQNVKLSHGSCATIARLSELEDEKLDGPVSVDHEVKDIVFEHVSFAYEEGNNVLRDVSFTIPGGKVTAIVGENGSGKSTVIKLLERFNLPASGKIMLGKADMEDVNLYEWRKEVGYLFQSDQLIKGSIRDNLCYGLDRECSEKELIQAAKLACAYDFIKSKEDGFDFRISRFDNRLSGGEMQRLAIARILLKNPKYLIMDEATSGIDVVNEKDVLNGIANLMKDKTVIMVSHDMKLIRKADHIVVLNKGVIEASGDYEYVLKNSELMKKMNEKLNKERN